MVTTIVFEVWDVFFNQSEELRSKLWNSLGVDDPSDIEKRMFEGDWVQAYHRGDLSEDAYWKGIIEMLPIDFKGHWTSLSRLFERTVWLDTDLVTTCHYLKKHFDLYVVSNAGPELRRRLKHFELTDLFKDIFISHEMGSTKPSAPIYKSALKVIGRAPEDILFVDPVYANILKAKEYGFHPYLYTHAQAFQQFFVYSYLREQTDDGKPSVNRRSFKGWKPFLIDGNQNSAKDGEA